MPMKAVSLFVLYRLDKQYSIPKNRDTICLIPSAFTTVRFLKYWHILKITLVLSVTILLFACKKESFITTADARVTLTADTLKYDTLFTSTGSTSRVFKIINENDRKLKVSKVKIMGGTSSAYKINVDGIVGPEVNDLELEPNDSIYVFVQVTVNPSAANLPFVIRDSVLVSYNGKDRFVQLEAWGQNAHFFRNKIITTDETWVNDLPYVILGALVVDTNKTLTINKGCRIYTHADAPIIIDGSLKINGQKDTADRVYFRGDRLDDPYRDYPAGWPGIFIRGSSKDNIFNYTVIKNAYQAIALQGPAANANPKLTLNECIIDNAYDAGIISINSSITAKNLLVSNCGQNIALVKGGNYQFTHCTVVAYNGLIDHKKPVLYVSNFVKVNNVPQPENMDATFTNCIFWGDAGFQVDDEVVTQKDNSKAFDVRFVNVLWRVKTTPANITPPVPLVVINNLAPLFDSINTFKNYYDFRLRDDSPAKDTGINAGNIIDLDGKPRPVAKPDLGCFEKQ
jgi:hypothetical protein